MTAEPNYIEKLCVKLWIKLKMTCKENMGYKHLQQSVSVRVVGISCCYDIGLCILTLVLIYYFCICKEMMGNWFMGIKL